MNSFAYIRASRRLLNAVQLLAAGTGGVVNALAFPAVGAWPLAFVGTTLILWSLRGRRFRLALLCGAVAGFSFWGVHIFWLTVYLGPVPWLALTLLETVFFAVGSALVALTYRAGRSLMRGPWLRLVAIPPVVAGLWTVREVVTSFWPYGGFSWGRLAFSQSASPFSEIVAWVGVSGLSFLMVCVSAIVVEVAALAAQGGMRRLGVRLVPAAVPIVLITVLVFVPAFPIVESGTARVAAVQGNADAGLFSEAEAGSILADQLRATDAISTQSVDVVLWPENAVDIDPLRDPATARQLDRLTAELDAPLVAGTITQNDDRTYNSLLLWQPHLGAVAQYDKMHPVPFAEYLPDRDFWYPLAPDLFSLIPRDFSLGTRKNVFDLEGFRAGLAICFDIVDDRLIQKMIGDGAEIILAPSNNADFGRSEESVQQLAVARIRAIQTGRSLVSASTVGTTAIISPDGSIIDRLPTFTAGALVADVPLSRTITPAVRFGSSIEAVIVWSSLLAAAALFGIVIRRRVDARRNLR